MNFFQELVADWTNGLVVVNSDILVACTSISQGVFCKRKVILGEKYYTSSEPNKYMLLGNILHSLFQVFFSIFFFLLIEH